MWPGRRACRGGARGGIGALREAGGAARCLLLLLRLHAMKLTGQHSFETQLT